MTGLRAELLGFGYPGRPLFAGFELQVPAGDYLAVVGPNGAGKSTLLRLLAGLVRPDAGRVTVAGRDTRGASRMALARLVAVVPQHSQFALDFTIEETVLMGRNPWLGRFGTAGDEDRRQVEEALAAMDLLELRQARIDEVSGGERQRAVVARALAQATPALLLDEPGSHLDLAHLDRLSGALARLNAQGRTVVVVSHDVNFAVANCRRLLVLKDGRAVALGPPAEVLTGELVRAVYGVEPVIIRHPDTGRPVLLLPGTQGRLSSGGVESAPSTPAA
ncbi:MAG: ABC transporter ATP-binding protein [bacterium]